MVGFRVQRFGHCEVVQDQARAGIDDGDAIGVPNVGPNHAIDPLHFIDELHRFGVSERSEQPQSLIIALN